MAWLTGVRPHSADYNSHRRTPSGVTVLSGKYQNEGENGGTKHSQAHTIDQGGTDPTAEEVESSLSFYHFHATNAAG